MVKANELRIGNILAPGEPEYKDSPPFAISFGDLKAIYDQNPEFKYVPVPLTEEWLVKFGLYKKDWAEGVVYELKFTLEQRKDGWYLCDNDFIGLQPIKYVHQLQNLHFALTGEELSPKK